PRCRPHLPDRRVAGLWHRRCECGRDFDGGRAVRRDEAIGHRARRIAPRGRGVHGTQICDARGAGSLSDNQKRAAAVAALELVRPGMTLGLGTGSTAAHFVELLGAKVKAGLDVVGVPTSEATRGLAKHAGIPLTTLEETPELDLTVDGADELDGRL